MKFSRKSGRRRAEAWLAQWEPPVTFPALRLPASDGKPYPPPPRIRTPQPDLWRTRRIQNRPLRRRKCHARS